MIARNDRQMYRWLEILPGGLVWLTLGLAVLVCFVQPTWAIGFILVFDVYWLVRIVYVMTYLLLAYRRFAAASNVHWLARVQEQKNWRDIWHVIFVPTANESAVVLRGTFQSLQAIDYPLDRCIVVLATEGRQAEYSRPIAAQIQQEFGHVFAHFLVVEHPAGIPGEVVGKGSNAAYAGKEVQKYIDAQHIPYNKIIVSTFDADSVAHPQYFSYLTYTFQHHPNQLRTSYQPIPLFHNNIWDALPLMRVVATSTTFWLLSETMRPDRLFTFSSHSMPWQALVDVGFWQTDVVSEDSRIFLQCLIRYDGDYSVTPMYMPISMDTVQSETWWRSIINQYKQIRRWAYGVENFPFMVWNFLHDPAMPLGKKIRYIWYQLEGTYSWAVAPVLILLLGWLPFHARPDITNQSALAQNAPHLMQLLMVAALTGSVVSAIVSWRLLPARPKHVTLAGQIVMGLQWLLLPISMIAFGAVPALESQTRLMLGKYLGFWVTEKARRTV